MKMLLSVLVLLVAAQAHAIDFKSPDVRFSTYEKHHGAGNLDMPGLSYESGLYCFTGEWFKASLPQQIVYRVRIENKRSENFYVVKMNGYFINSALMMKNATPVKEDFDGKPRARFCKGNFVESSLMGFKVGFEMTVVKTDVGPAPADVILDESETATLSQVYGPIFKSALSQSQSSSFDLPFFGSEAYKNVDNKDPIAIAIAAMTHAKTVDPSRAESVPVVTLTNSF